MLSKKKRTAIKLAEKSQDTHYAVPVSVSKIDTMTLDEQAIYVVQMVDSDQEMLDAVDRDRILVSYWSNCASSTDDNSVRFSNIKHMMNLFMNRWEEVLSGNERANIVLTHIRARFEMLLSSNDAALVDSVILTALEHMFQVPNVASYFRSGSKEANIVSAYAEAARLAGDIATVEPRSARKQRRK